ncbi:hypothetical protein [Natrinema hispanicum]|nr:hypothetical protein [Natrinema hispanicum]
MERIAWHLNYCSDETVPINKIAEETGLSWATARKYAQAIETQQKIAPKIEIDDKGVTVGRKSSAVTRLFANTTRAIAVYLLNNAELKGGATQPLSFEEHSEVLENHTESVEKMEALGWVELLEGEIRLTPLGVQIAGSERSKVKNTERNPRHDIPPVWKNQGVASAEFSGNIIKFDEEQEEASNTFDKDGKTSHSIDPTTAAMA